MAGQLSGQVIVATAGTAVQLPNNTDALPNTDGGGNFFITALCSNTGCIYIGRDDSAGGDVDSTNGFPLLAGQGIQLNVPDLSAYYVDADVDGEGIAWLKPCNG